MNIKQLGRAYFRRRPDYLLLSGALVAMCIVGCGDSTSRQGSSESRAQLQAVGQDSDSKEGEGAKLINMCVAAHTAVDSHQRRLETEVPSLKLKCKDMYKCFSARKELGKFLTSARKEHGRDDSLVQIMNTTCGAVRSYDPTHDGALAGFLRHASDPCYNGYYTNVVDVQDVMQKEDEFEIKGELNGLSVIKCANIRSRILPVDLNNPENSSSPFKPREWVDLAKQCADFDYLENPLGQFLDDNPECAVAGSADPVIPAVVSPAVVPAVSQPEVSDPAVIVPAVSAPAVLPPVVSKQCSAVRYFTVDNSTNTLVLVDSAININFDSVTNIDSSGDYYWILPDGSHISKRDLKCKQS